VTNGSDGQLGGGGVHEKGRFDGLLGGGIEVEGSVLVTNTGSPAAFVKGVRTLRFQRAGQAKAMRESTCAMLAE